MNKETINNYKNSMIHIFTIKYGIPEIISKKWIREFDFNNMLKSCNYIALHDDLEI